MRLSQRLTAFSLAVALTAASSAYAEENSSKSFGSLKTLAFSGGDAFTQQVTRRQKSLHRFGDMEGSSAVYFGDKVEESGVDKILEHLGKQFGFEGGAGSMPQLWTSSTRREGRVGDKQRLDSYEYDLSGFAGGIDMRLSQSWSVGVAGGYTKASSRFESMGRTAADVNAYHTAFYAGFERAGVSVDTNLSFNIADNRSKRQTAPQNIATAKGYGYEVGWSVTAMGHLQLDKLSITPTGGFTLAQLYRGGMRETDDINGMASGEMRSMSLRPMIGINVARSIALDHATRITPELYGIYRYEMMDADEDTIAHLQRSGGVQRSSTHLSRNMAQLGAGLNASFGDHLFAKLQFDSDLSPTAQDYRGTMRIAYRW